MLPIFAVAEAARDDATRPHSANWRSRRDERRISAALRRIEAHADDTLSLSDLANAVAMSPRTFRAVVGVSSSVRAFAARRSGPRTAFRPSRLRPGAATFQRSIAAFNALRASAQASTAPIVVPTWRRCRD
jgi:methylphosphotriester-DNA--protein-cysteine methyltransferase